MKTVLSTAVLALVLLRLAPGCLSEGEAADPALALRAMRPEAASSNASSAVAVAPPLPVQADPPAQATPARPNRLGSVSPVLPTNPGAILLSQIAACHVASRVRGGIANAVAMQCMAQALSASATTP